jgi:threonyl-tRNA synthetase
MERIVRENQRFVRRVVTEDEARAEMADEPFKLELIGLAGGPGAGSTEGASVEVGAASSRSTTTSPATARPPGATSAAARTCPAPARRERLGPHPHRRRLLARQRRTRSCSASTAPPGPKDELRAYQQRLEEAAKRDHRKLGKELDLFSFPEEIGSGLSVWHPKGGIIRGEMEQHARRRHIAGGYTYVYTPHISKGTSSSPRTTS